MGVFSGAATVTIAVTTSSASVAIGNQTDVGGASVRVANTGTGLAFIAFGKGSATATTSGLPILPGTVEAFEIGSATYVAAITATGSTTLYFTPGMGA